MDSSMTLSQVAMSGPVDEHSASSVPESPTPEIVATHGLIVIGAAQLDMNKVDAEGFALLGILIVSSYTQWNQGAIHETLGTGVMISGGTAELQNLSISSVYEGSQMEMSYGAIFSDNAQVITDNVEVSENQSIAILNDNSQVTHIDLNVSENRYGGLWSQQCPSIEINGPDTIFENNYFAGFFSVGIVETTITGGTFLDTIKAKRVMNIGTVEAGDGIQIDNPLGPIFMSDLVIKNNERVGLFINVHGGWGDGIDIQDVYIEGQDNQLGAIAQGDGIPSDWDSGITRGGATA